MLEATDVVLCRTARQGLAGRLQQFGGWFALSSATSAPDKRQTTLAGETTDARVQATVVETSGVVRYDARITFGVDDVTVGQLAIMSAESGGQPIAIASVVPMQSVAGRPYRLFLEVDFTA